MSTKGLDFNERFAATHSKSRELWERSLRASRGTHHDARYAQPFPVYVARARGSRKWDVDGNEYIDFTMGHGSLMFGHAHPAFVEVVAGQLGRGTHFGNEHSQALEWAELVCQLVPAAERVEFTMTGTEADMMCAQLARAYTGRQKILKFAEHFFGWSNDLLVGVAPPYDKPVAGRLPRTSDDTVSDSTVVIPTNDEAALERALKGKDIAALFIEGAGAHAGDLGMPLQLIRAARQLTEKFGTLLVIDEVVSGFRWSPGGYQATVGVTPDLSSLGKMVSGGLPGAGVCGRADVMDLLQIREGQGDWNRHRRIAHPGTWNANPLSAVAGVTMLKMIASGEPQRHAEGMAARLADGVNGKIEERGVDGCAFNSSSVFHLFLGRCHKCDRSICLDTTKSSTPGAANAADRHLQANGVHLLRGASGWVSAIHTEDDIDQAIEAFGQAFDGLIEEGALIQTG